MLTVEQINAVIDARMGNRRFEVFSKASGEVHTKPMVLSAALDEMEEMGGCNGTGNGIDVREVKNP